MEAFLELAKKIAVGVLLLGIAAYGLLMLAYVLGWPEAQALLKESPSHTFGLPISAITAFAIVALLEQRYSDKPKSETLNFKAFGLDFTGPAGPTTLWVVCYLTLVASMRLVGK